MNPINYAAQRLQEVGHTPKSKLQTFEIINQLKTRTSAALQYAFIYLLLTCKFRFGQERLWLTRTVKKMSRNLSFLVRAGARDSRAHQRFPSVQVYLKLRFRSSRDSCSAVRRANLSGSLRIYLLFQIRVKLRDRRCSFLKAIRHKMKVLWLHQSIKYFKYDCLQGKIKLPI